MGVNEDYPTKMRELVPDRFAIIPLEAEWQWSDIFGYDLVLKEIEKTEDGMIYRIMLNVTADAHFERIDVVPYDEVIYVAPNKVELKHRLVKLTDHNLVAMMLFASVG